MVHYKVNIKSYIITVNGILQRIKKKVETNNVAISKDVWLLDKIF